MSPVSLVKSVTQVAVGVNVVAVSIEDDCRVVAMYNSAWILWLEGYLGRRPAQVKGAYRASD